MEEEGEVMKWWEPESSHLKCGLVAVSFVSERIILDLIICHPTYVSLSLLFQEIQWYESRSGTRRLGS